MQAVRTSVLLLAAVLTAGFAGVVFGSDDRPLMITDRPTVSVSASTVPRGYVQLETNLAYNVDRIIQNRIEVEVNSFDLLNALARFGVSNHVELRMATVYTFKSADAPSNSASIDGINGLIVGTKIRLFGQSGLRPEAALLLEVGLPVGKEEFTEDETLPIFLFAVSHTFDKRFGIGVNIGGQKTLESDFLFRWSVAMPVAITHRVAVFAEVFGNAAEGIDPMVSVDGGGIWQIRRNIQVEATGGIALTEEGNDWFSTVGFSFRLPG